MRKLLVLVAAAAALVLGGGLPAQAAGTASVSVVHGIPGTPVNVFVNGKPTLPNFQPGTVAGPLSLPAGSYTVTVFPASDTAGTGTPVIKATAQVAAGGNYSLVAHLDAAGKPTLTAYKNNTSTIPAGKARITVRHDAAAPAVDVRANGAVVFAKLTNPGEASAVVPAGSVRADVVLAGTTTVAIGPATLNLASGSNTVVYAVGSADQKTLGLVTQTLTGMGAAPRGVGAGTGGLLPGAHGTPEWAWPVTGAGAALAVLGGLGLARTARRRTAA